MALPVAGIVCIVLACWVVVVLALFGLYQFLKHRGSCKCECAPCGTEGGESCTCCKAISDACNCCNPSLNGCLNSICPKKKVSCVDIVLCQCCAEPGQDSCLVNTLQYTFYCPCKCFAEHCMVGYGNSAVTIWNKEGMSFCQWTGSKLGCSMCESVQCCDCDCCSKSAPEDCECFSVLCASCKSIQPANVKCLECDCNNSLQALCSKFDGWTCTCAKDDNSCFNVCKNHSCCISSGEPITCPTFEVEVSNNLTNVLWCPGCPDHVLCFSCSEDQGINWCCHYVFCNRCGDPNFEYDPSKTICIGRGNNIFTCIFQVLQSLCRCLCLSCFGLCENSIRCCFYSSLFCADCVCCNCSNEDFCKQCTFLCFDCHKLSNSVKNSQEKALKGCSCGCFIFNSYESPAICEITNQEFEVLASSPSLPESLGSPPYFREIQEPLPSLPDNIHLVRKENTRKKSLSAPVRNHEHLCEGDSFNIVNERKEPSTRTKSGKKVGKKRPKPNSVNKRKPRMNRISVRQQNSKCEKLDNEDADIGADDERDSCQDLEHMQRLQDDLLRRTPDETETDAEELSVGSTPIESKTSSNYLDDQEFGYGQKEGMSNDLRKKSKTEDKGKPKGRITSILKPRSIYSRDYKETGHETTAFSIYNEHRGRASTRKKRAHFANEDEELFKELFPQNFADSCSDETTVKGRTKQKRRRRRKANSDAVRRHDTSSDESEIQDNIRTSSMKSNTGDVKWKSNLRPFSDESDRMFESTKQTSNKFLSHATARSHTSSHDSNLGQSRKVGSGKYKKKVASENSKQYHAVQLTDYRSSEEEIGTERFSNKSLDQNVEESSVKFVNDEITIESVDDLTDEENTYV